MLKLKKSVLPEELLLNETEKKLLEEEGKKYGEPLKEIEKDIKYGMCFACGEENPVGLHLHFFWIPNGVMAFFTPKPEHQSYNGRMHGGLITVLLDEIMGNYLFKKEGVPAYTARIDLRFRTPVQIGTTIRCEGHEVKRKGRLVVMEGVIINPDGTVAAEATSTLMLEK
jgi:uncharacterized protein (TIGR00369 family)